MKKFLLTLMIAILLAGCSVGATTTSTAATAPSANTTTGQSTGAATDSTTATAVPPATGAEIENVHGDTHDDASDYQYDAAAALAIQLNGDSISASGEGVSVNGSSVTISAAGTYAISGTLADGQIIVDTSDEEIVRLILKGAEITSNTSAPIYIRNAEKVMIVLAENTSNRLSDANSYTFAIPEEEEPDAAIFSKADLTISGSGALRVDGNFRDAIASKDGLIIASGNITVSAVDDAIRGKDYLVVKDGNLVIDAQGDGLKSDNEEDAEKGYVQIQAGSFQITAAGDAIQAQTDLIIAAGQFTLVTGGGSSGSLAADVSAKGLKASGNISIQGGAFTIDAADDAVHANGSLIVDGGTFDITTGDDGLHADATLTINNGEVRIAKSYEGIESAVITINDGSVSVVASDDGINVAGGNDSSGFGPGGRPGGPGSAPGQDAFNDSGTNYLYIHGGNITVDANGDGLDINGAIEMSGGVVQVNGPTEQMNAPLDYDGTFVLTGGWIAAAGSSGMAQAPSQTSSQPALMVFFTATQPAGSLVHIQDSAGKDILTFAPSKDYQSLAFSSPDLVQGETYTIFTGGSSTGALNGSLYTGGAYTPGAEYSSFTVTTTVTTLGTGGGGGRRRP